MHHYLREINQALKSVNIFSPLNLLVFRISLEWIDELNRCFFFQCYLLMQYFYVVTSRRAKKLTRKHVRDASAINAWMQRAMHGHPSRLYRALLHSDITRNYAPYCERYYVYSATECRGCAAVEFVEKLHVARFFKHAKTHADIKYSSKVNVRKFSRHSSFERPYC